MVEMKVIHNYDLMDKLTSNEVSTIDIDELLREFQIKEE